MAREFIKLTSQHEADGEADAQITESRTETGSEKQLGTSSGSEVRTPTMNDDDMIWRIRRESLIGHYEWVRGKAVEHSQLRMLTEQARNVLLTEPGNPGWTSIRSSPRRSMMGYTCNTSLGVDFSVGPATVP